MDNVAVAIVALAGGIAEGAVLGFVARSRWANQSVKVAQEKAGRIVADARTQQKDLILEAKEDKIRLLREAEDEARSRRTELARYVRSSNPRRR